MDVSLGQTPPTQSYIQIDTTNILFICGGAFAGLDKIIAARGKGSAMGFGADVRDNDDRGVGGSTGDYSAIETLMQNLMGCYADQYERGGLAKTPHLDRMAAGDGGAPAGDMAHRLSTLYRDVRLLILPVIPAPERAW